MDTPIIGAPNRHYDEHISSAISNDGLDPELRGMAIHFSSKTKFLSIECELSKDRVKGLVMIDTGASITCVDENLRYTRGIY
jgi:hypothetical protein